MKIAHFGCVVGGLVVGAGLGWAWASHGRSESLLASPAMNDPGAVPSAAVLVDAKPIQPSECLRSAEAQTLHRLEVLKWFKALDERSSLLLRVSVFDGEAELNRGFVRAFGLSAGEASSLQGAVRRANERMNTLLAAAAKVRVEADNSRAWVELPALPTEGGQIFDELLQTFKATLGPERLPYFEEFSADSFDYAFRAFGARQSTFELQRKTLDDGQLAFSIMERYNLPESSGTSGSLVPSSDLAKSFPMLAKALPPTFTQATAKP